MRLCCKKSFCIYVFLASLLLATFLISHYFSVNEGPILSPPSLDNWFGTDTIGNDLFLKCVDSLFLVLITIAVVCPAVYLGGLILGAILSYFENPKFKELLLNLIHYWATLPVLLLALFLLILIGAGQQNVIVILIFVLLPSQSLYVYSQLEEAKKQSFVVAKKSCGFTSTKVILGHLLPYIRNSYRSYALSRLPELLMMDLAFNFLGLGAQTPQSSFGQILFEGLSFMFSAWWIWFFPVLAVSGIFVFITIIWNTSQINDVNRSVNNYDIRK